MNGLKKNIFYQSVYEILIIILPLITSPYIARVLGAESIGIYSYTYSIAHYFVLFAMLGINNYGNRSIARVRDNQEQLNNEFSSIFLLHIFISVMAIVSYILYLLIFVNEDNVLAIIQMLWVVSALFDINWFFFGIEKFKLTVVRNSFIKILTVCSIFIFVKSPDDLWKYGLIMAGGNLIGQSMIWFYLKKYVTFVRPKLNEVLLHIKPMLLLFIPVISVSLYKYMDKIMLGSLSTKVQVGFYENGLKAINIPTGMIIAFGTVMMPKMSNLVSKGETKLSEKYLSISIEFIMCLAIGMSFGLGSVANAFSIIMWGNEFAPVGELIQLLSICTIFISFANVIRTQYLIPQGKDRIYIISVILGAIVNIVINLKLIPLWQAKGAAIGTVFAEFTVLVVQLLMVQKYLPIYSYMKSIIYFLFLGGFMSIIVNILNNTLSVSLFNLVIIIIIGGCFYMVGSIIYFVKVDNKIVVGYIKKFRTMKVFSKK